MFDRFDKDSREALLLARIVTTEREGEEMGGEDLLNGIVLVAASAVLRSTSGNVESLTLGETADDVLARVAKDRTGANTREIRFSKDLKAVLERAVEEADALGHQAIRPEHLVLGLLRDEGTSAWHTLHRAGVRLREVRRMLKAEPEESAGNNATGHD